MKILHINTNFGGGAAVAAKRIHSSLLNNNVDSKMLFLDINSDNNDKTFNKYTDYENPLSFYLKNKLNRLIHQFYSGFDNGNPISIGRSPFNLTNKQLVKEADIIHLHWVSKFLDYSKFFKNMSKPIVWTLHDMAPFSSGFHYNFNYDENKNKDKLAKIENYKLNALKKIDNIKIISPSSWLLNESKKSNVFGRFEHKKINNPIDTSTFNVKDKVALRKKYDIDEKDKVLMFIADNLNDERKGIKYLYSIIDDLLNEKIKLLIVGNGSPFQNSKNENIRNVGFVNNSNKLAELYNVADVYIMPSLQDNSPNTIIESLSCGTPVLVFDNSGNIEFVRHKKNGYVAKNMSSEDLFNGVNFLCGKTDINRDEISNEIHSSCSEKKVSLQYLELYNSILK